MIKPKVTHSALPMEIISSTKMVTSSSHPQIMMLYCDGQRVKSCSSWGNNKLQFPRWFYWWVTLEWLDIHIYKWLDIHKALDHMKAPLLPYQLGDELPKLCNSVLARVGRVHTRKGPLCLWHSLMIITTASTATLVPSLSVGHVAIIRLTQHFVSGLVQDCAGLGTSTM